MEVVHPKEEHKVKGMEFKFKALAEEGTETTTSLELEAEKE